MLNLKSKLFLLLTTALLGLVLTNCNDSSKSTTSGVRGSLQASSSTSTWQFHAKQVDSGNSGKFPGIGDFNNDGLVEPMSTLATPSGGFTLLNGANIGLQRFDSYSSLNPNNFLTKTVRIADFNRDGYDDILSIPYGECTGNLTNLTRLYINNKNNTFTEDVVFQNIPGIRGRGETTVVADFDNDGDLDIFIPFYNRIDDIQNCSTFSQAGHTFRPTNRLLRNDSTPTLLKFTDITGGAGLTWCRFTNTLVNNNRVYSEDPDCQGQTEGVKALSVEMRPPDRSVYEIGPPEGVQAADIDADGKIDMWIGQRLYLNNGGMVFQNYTIIAGLPTPTNTYFEEGTKFLDWNNDGLLDIISLGVRGFGIFQSQIPGNTAQNLGVIRLFEQQPKSMCASGVRVCFKELKKTPDGSPIASVVQAGVKVNATTCEAYGLWGYDVDNNGYEDIIISGTAAGSRSPCGAAVNDPGYAHQWGMFSNNRKTGSGFELVTPNVKELLDANGTLGNELAFGGSLHIAFADFDKDSKIDLSIFGGDPLGSNAHRYVLYNRSILSGNAISVDVLSSDGTRNQQGRVLKVKCNNNVTSTMTRVVDGGSGYLTNSQYSVLIGIPTSSTCEVSVLLPMANNPSNLINVNVTLNSGQRVRIFQPDANNPNGRYQIY